MWSLLTSSDVDRSWSNPRVLYIAKLLFPWVPSKQWWRVKRRREEKRCWATLGASGGAEKVGCTSKVPYSHIHQETYPQCSSATDYTVSLPQNWTQGLVKMWHFWVLMAKWWVSVHTFSLCLHLSGRWGYQCRIPQGSVQRTGLSVQNPRISADWISRPLPLSTQHVSLGFWNFTHRFYLAIAANNENITGREISPEVL